MKKRIIELSGLLTSLHESVGRGSNYLEVQMYNDNHNVLQRGKVGPYVIFIHQYVISVSVIGLKITRDHA